MNFKLFYNKSVHENAAYYYDLAKKSKEKLAGVEKAIEQTQKELHSANKPQKKDVRIKKEKQWYEKFHYFFTSGNRLAIGGRNAQQNDQVVAKYFEELELFFHADIQGGMVVILKDGTSASEQELVEVAHKRH